MVEKIDQHQMVDAGGILNQYQLEVVVVEAEGDEYQEVDHL